MNEDRPFFSNLKCRECGRLYKKEAIHICEYDFGPLEAAYDYEAIRQNISREILAARPESMWRYRELLPIDGAPTVGQMVGFTPLIKSDRLAKALGVSELYIKNDTVNYPTLSFKDRVVSVALSRARELGFQVVACASTGNLANSVAAAGLRSYVLIPADLEQSKVLGSLVYGTNVIGIHGPYDQVNRLCSEIAGKYGWGFVNVNLRPYYAEGSKSMGFEIAEQLGWKLPRHTVVPMASGSLLTKIHKAYKEFIHTGILEDQPFSIHGAQASGCSPISEAMKKGTEIVKPVPKPQTIVKSLAIGTPADGYYAIRTMKETGGRYRRRGRGRHPPAG
jgi:threonine synthase